MNGRLFIAHFIVQGGVTLLTLQVLLPPQAFTASNPSFNASDLFVEDGVYKWDNSCYAPIQLV